MNASSRAAAVSQESPQDFPSQWKGLCQRWRQDVCGHAHGKAVPVCCGCPWGVVQCAFPPTSDEVLFSSLTSKSSLCPICTIEKDLNLTPYWCQWRAAPNIWGLWNTFILIYSSTTTLDVTPEVELDLTEWIHLVPSAEAGGSTFPFLWHWLLKSFLFFPQPFEAVGQSWAGLGHPYLSFLHPSRSIRVVKMCRANVKLVLIGLWTCQPQAWRALPELSSYSLLLASLLQFRLNGDWKWAICVKQLFFSIESNFFLNNQCSDRSQKFLSLQRWSGGERDLQTLD